MKTTIIILSIGLLIDHVLCMENVATYPHSIAIKCSPTCPQEVSRICGDGGGHTGDTPSPSGNNTCLIRESWNVSNYCVSTAATVGGWGFSAQTIKSLSFSAKMDSVSAPLPPPGAIEAIVGIRTDRDFPLTGDLSTAKIETNSSDLLYSNCRVEQFTGLLTELLTTNYTATDAAISFNLTDARFSSSVAHDYPMIGILSASSALCPGAAFPLPPSLSDIVVELLYVHPTA